MFARCLHDWEIKDKTVTENPFQQMMKEKNISIKDAPAWVFKEIYILVLACKKCGALDKTFKEITL